MINLSDLSHLTAWWTIRILDKPGIIDQIHQHSIKEIYQLLGKITYPRWFELLGSTAPIPANFLAEKVGTKTESHGLETWPQPQKYSQSRKSTNMFPWLKTRGCEVTLHLTTYMFQVAETTGAWDAGPRIYCAMAGNLGFISWLMCLFSQCCWSPLVQHFRQAPGFLAPNGG